MNTKNKTFIGYANMIHKIYKNAMTMPEKLQREKFFF